MANLKMLTFVVCSFFAFITIEAQGPPTACQQNFCAPCWQVTNAGYAIIPSGAYNGYFFDYELTTSLSCSDISATTYCADYCEDEFDAWSSCGMSLEFGPGQWQAFSSCFINYYTYSPNLGCFSPPCPVEKRRSVFGENENEKRSAHNVTNPFNLETSSIPGYTDPEPKFLGCFADSGTRDLPHGPETVDSVEECIQYCSGLQYGLAGNQDGDQCFCGNTHGAYGTSTNCNVECGDDELCGGGYANDIYTTGWLGCYVDSGVRDMSYTQTSSGTVTVEGCRAACFALGYKYAGCQDGNQCFCSNTYGRYGEVSGSGGCAVPCSGNSNEFCGGSYQNAVYTANQNPSSN